MGRPTLRANISESDGMEPEDSSREIRSTRFIGKKIVGKPVRSLSGPLIWLMKWSKELRSMPRMVMPDGLMDSSCPHSFSLGVCRLTMMIECGSTISDDCSPLGYPAVTDFTQSDSNR